MKYCYLLLLPVTVFCFSCQAPVAKKSLVRDSLDKIANREAGKDFCEIMTVADLNYYQARVVSEQSFPLSDNSPASERRKATVRRMTLFTLNEQSNEKYKWSDSIVGWALANNHKLDTPCSEVPMYSIKYKEGKDIIDRKYKRQ